MRLIEMNIKKIIEKNKFTSKDVFSPIRAIAIISSSWIASYHEYKILIVGER